MDAMLVDCDFAMAYLDGILIKGYRKYNIWACEKIGEKLRKYGIKLSEESIIFFTEDKIPWSNY